jgi:hypothetical protein
LAAVSEVEGVGGRYSLAILQLGTAMEVLVSTLIREIASRRGIDVTNVLGPNGPGLRNLVVDHLPRYIGASVRHDDLDGTGHPMGWWWTSGYGLRDRVAHDGYRAHGGDAEDAVMAARHVVRWLGERLSAQSDTADLGDRLSWLVRPVTTDEDAEDE